jgi:hypothetical protein
VELEQRFCVKPDTAFTMHISRAGLEQLDFSQSMPLVPFWHRHVKFMEVTPRAGRELGTPGARQTPEFLQGLAAQGLKQVHPVEAWSWYTCMK